MNANEREDAVAAAIAATGNFKFSGFNESTKDKFRRQARAAIDVVENTLWRPMDELPPVTNDDGMKILCAVERGGTDIDIKTGKIADAVAFGFVFPSGRINLVGYTGNWKVLKWMPCPNPN